MSRRAADLVGQRFGRLTVIRRVESKDRNSAWLCMCDCGNYTTVIAPNLKSGKSKSCGCRTTESIVARSTTHGESQTRLYRIWKAMKDRCYRKGNIGYARYGGRGITVCDEWLQEYVAFRDWAMSHGYNDSLTIDRIDNDKGYSPDNCRWVNASEQNLNKRNNHSVTYQGKTQTITQWAEELGIAPNILIQRFWRGWSAEKAFTTLVKHPRQK